MAFQNIANDVDPPSLRPRLSLQQRIETVQTFYASGRNVPLLIDTIRTQMVDYFDEGRCHTIVPLCRTASPAVWKCVAATPNICSEYE